MENCSHAAGIGIRLLQYVKDLFLSGEPEEVIGKATVKLLTFLSGGGGLAVFEVR